MRTHAIAVKFLLLLGILSSQTQILAQSFKVLVLDALDGKPQLGIKIGYFCESKGGLPSNSVPTDASGVAEIPFICSEGTRIELSASGPNVKYGKEECGDLEPITLQEILSVGIISNPSGDGGIWCPTKISRKLKPIPGQVILFVKKPTWWQVHVAG